MSPVTALEFAQQNSERFLSELKELLRIPSVSTLPEHRSDMERAAEWLRGRLSSIGLQAEVLQGTGHPLVYADWLEAGGAPTVLVYGHYDVQPVDPIDLWDNPPFEPTEKNGSLYARGASDDKGQTMTLINAAESLLKTDGRLPINVKFLLEGEEECGGAEVKGYVDRHGDRLSADVVQIADSHMFGPGIPTLESALRGTIYTEVTARGASQDLHSGLYGGVAPNPLNALGQVIAGLKDREGHVTIPGFYDDVRMPDEQVLRSWRELPFDEEEFRRREVGSSMLVGEPEFSPIERTWARPTLDVHGISGGFTGEGAKTVIPAVATAKISMRLVPDQRADRSFELFQRRVHELAPAGIELEARLIHGDNPVVVELESPFVQMAKAALEETFGRAPVLARSGGSIPIVGVIKAKLGIDTILMGWGLPDDNLHAPNEKFSIENFRKGTEATIRFWEGLGESPAVRT